MDFGKKIRFGNFEVLKYKKGDAPVVRVSDFGDSWAMEFSVNHKMFAALDRVEPDNEDEKNSAQFMMIAWYAVSAIHDAQFIAGVHGLVEKWIDSAIAQEESTDEEKEEMVNMSEMEEEFNVIENEEGEGNQGAADSASERL